MPGLYDWFSSFSYSRAVLAECFRNNYIQRSLTSLCMVSERFGTFFFLSSLDDLRTTSIWNLEEIMAEGNLSVDHVTI